MAETCCPACSADITPDDVNVKEGVAYCRACDKVWRLGELAGVGVGAGPGPVSVGEDAAEEAVSDEVASRGTPDGCWVRDLGDHTVVGARCRSSTGWFFLCFSAFWNSITWVFVAIALSEILSPPPPPEMPSGMVEAVKANPALERAVQGGGGEAWIMLAALTPFILVGGLTGVFALVGLVGKVEVRLRGQKGEVFTGIGGVGWRRPFSADLVRGVKIADANSTTNGKRDKRIVIEADNDIGLGVWLTPLRRRWLAGALRAVLRAGV